MSEGSSASRSAATSCWSLACLRSLTCFGTWPGTRVTDNLGALHQEGEYGRRIPRVRQVDALHGDPEFAVALPQDPADPRVEGIDPAVPGAPYHAAGDRTCSPGARGRAPVTATPGAGAPFPSAQFRQHRPPRLIS